MKYFLVVVPFIFTPAGCLCFRGAARIVLLSQRLQDKTPCAHDDSWWQGTLYEKRCTLTITIYGYYRMPSETEKVNKTIVWWNLQCLRSTALTVLHLPPFAIQAPHYFLTESILFLVCSQCLLFLILKSVLLFWGLSSSIFQMTCSSDTCTLLGQLYTEKWRYFPCYSRPETVSKRRSWILVICL